MLTQGFTYQLVSHKELTAVSIRSRLSPSMEFSFCQLRFYFTVSTATRHQKNKILTLKDNTRKTQCSPDPMRTAPFG